MDENDYESEYEDYTTVDDYYVNKDFNFDSLKITTITMMFYFKGVVLDVKSTFKLLPVTVIPESEFVKKKKTIKLKHLPISSLRKGAILGLGHANEWRGIKRSEHSNFKNSIPMDIQAGEKCMNLKLYEKKIQLSGADKIESGIDAARCLINHVNYVQKILDRIHNRKISWVKTIKTILYIKEITKSATKIPRRKIIYEEFINNKKIICYENVLFSPINKNIVLNCVPNYIDQKLFSFCLLQIGDFKDYDKYCKNLDLILETTNIISEPLELLAKDVSMMNCNFNLDYKIDRCKLNKIFNKLGFYSTFDINFKKPPVFIYIPYELDKSKYDFIDTNDEENDEDYLKYRSCSTCETESGDIDYIEDGNVESCDDVYENTSDYMNENSVTDLDFNDINDSEEMQRRIIESKLIINENKRKKITILVYKRGSITISAPCYDILKETFITFFNHIKRIKKYIEFKE